MRLKKFFAGAIGIAPGWKYSYAAVHASMRQTSSFSIRTGSLRMRTPVA